MASVVPLPELEDELELELLELDERPLELLELELLELELLELELLDDEVGIPEHALRCPPPTPQAMRILIQLNFYSYTYIDLLQRIMNLIYQTQYIRLHFQSKQVSSEIHNLLPQCDGIS